MQEGHTKRYSQIALILLCVGAFAAYMFVSGGLQNLSASSLDRQTGSTPSDLATPVRLIPLNIEEQISVERRFQGRLEARQSSDIGFEFGGTLDTVAVAEGDRVQKGDVLATLRIDAFMFERTALQENLNAVQTQFDTTEARYERTRDLVRRRLAPSGQLDQVESERGALASRLIELKNSFEQNELRIEKSRLVAPFDGIVGARFANLGETVAAGDPIVTIFERGGANIRVALPAALEPAEILEPQIALNGQTYDVTLKAVRPDVDFRTNTRVALYDIDTPDLARFGLSVTLRGQVSLPLRGAWIPVEAMRPSSEGYWIILAVSDDMIAQAVAVEVQYLRSDEAYVMGAFETGTRIVGSGAHKVVPGQSVRAD